MQNQGVSRRITLRNYSIRHYPAIIEKEILKIRHNSCKKPLFAVTTPQQTSFTVTKPQRGGGIDDNGCYRWASFFAAGNRRKVRPLASLIIIM